MRLLGRERLRREAIDAAARRGHRLGKFRRHGYYPTQSTANCMYCCCTVTINQRPAANEIDIGGDAVAIGCANPPGGI